MIAWYSIALVLAIVSAATNSLPALAAGMIVALVANIVERW